LQQQRAKQLLRRYRRTADLGIQSRKQFIQGGQGLIRNLPDHPQRMILRYPALRPNITKKPITTPINTTHLPTNLELTIPRFMNQIQNN